MNKFALLAVVIPAVMLCGCGAKASDSNKTETAPSTQPNGQPVTLKIYKFGRAEAEVVTLHNVSKESAVTVKVDGEVVFRRAFFSDDENHGDYIMDAAWSPDGAYFAYKLASSGGHQPYRSPVEILNVKDRTLIDAEAIIKKMPQTSYIAVSDTEKPYLKWLSNTQLQVSVMINVKESDAGTFYIIDVVKRTAHKQPAPAASRPSNRPTIAPASGPAVAK